jgi:hypothetical protein
VVTERVVLAYALGLWALLMLLGVVLVATS